MTLLSVDASYAVTERWSVSGYTSFTEQTIGEADKANYIADTTSRNTAAGLKVVGKPTGVIEVGAALTRLYDSTYYKLSSDFATTAANQQQILIGLPEVRYSDTRLGVYASYALTRRSDVRLDVTRISVRLDEWTWGYNGVPWIYSDGTTVSVNPRQQTTFAAARFIYRF
jgi:hypothetical protein